ncbi:hypothetical protein V6N13_121526 [Hibiscus sabdariffa]
MRIVLNQERKEYVIIESVPNEPVTNSPRASKDKFEKHMDDILDVGCLVLATITLELQKQHEYVVSYEMIQNLKEIFSRESTTVEGHALETVAFTLNRVSSKSVQKTPHEIWTGKSPNMSFMKGRNIELKEVQQEQVHEPEVKDSPQVVEENSTDLETQPLRRSTRERHEPERYGFLITTHGDVILVDQDEPKNYQ